MTDDIIVPSGKSSDEKVEVFAPTHLYPVTFTSKVNEDGKVKIVEEKVIGWSTIDPIRSAHIIGDNDLTRAIGKLISGAAEKTYLQGTTLESARKEWEERGEGTHRSSMGESVVAVSGYTTAKGDKHKSPRDNFILLGNVILDKRGDRLFGKTHENDEWRFHTDYLINDKGQVFELSKKDEERGDFEMKKGAVAVGFSQPGVDKVQQLLRDIDSGKVTLIELNTTHSDRQEIWRKKMKEEKSKKTKEKQTSENTPGVDNGVQVAMENSAQLPSPRTPAGAPGLMGKKPVLGA